MRRYEVYRPKQGNGYLLDCQSDWLEDFGSRVVVPLLPISSVKAVSRLNPIFDIDGQSHIMSTQLIFAIPNERLGKRIGSLESQHLEITAALDTLFGTY
jgi:toxin CcdB